MEIFIEHPDQLLKEVWKDHNIHIVQNQHALGRDKFCLIDISMNAQGRDQDQIYTDSVFYRTNIRRGNTLVEILDQKGKEKNKIRWGRKGIEKIIDIKLQYLQNITNKISLNKEQKKSAEYIFRNVNRCLQKGKRVQLLKTQKANGQNAQVSYFYELDAWIVCSKNFSMIVASVQDIQMYQGKRYTYAKQIAKQWFEQIKSLNKQTIKKIKKLLDGFTLVGEYCGNPEHQHLIIYAEIRIIWFALIDNFTEEYCVDPFEVKRQVEEFGFKFVKIKRLGSFIDKKTLYSALQNLYIKIAEASMEDQQYGLEGSFVYFVSPQMKENKAHTKVLGSGKLKTIEYRFFRKIREKLSRYVNRKQSQAELVRKFQDECLQLQKSNNSCALYPQHYYTQILRKGCELIRQVKINEDFLRSKFCSILKLLFYVVSKNISLKSFGNKMITNNDFLDQVTKIQLQKYGPLGCNTKIIYFSTDLVQLKDKTTSEYLKNHFKTMKLFFKHLYFANARNNETQRLFNQINNSSVPQKFPHLMHFHVQGCLTIQDIQKIANRLKYKGKKNFYHQILLITDQISSGQLFKNNQDEFPFRLQTIALSYFRVYQSVKNTPTIQQRIDDLKKVTENLKLKDTFMQQLSKKSFRHFQYPRSNLVNFQENQKTQLIKIVSGLLSGQRQYENYCRLILKLDKYTQDRFPSQSEQQTNASIKALIKSSFYDIPEIDFRIKI